MTMLMSDRILSEWKEDSLSQRNQLSHSTLSHIKPEGEESLIQGKIHIQQNSKKDYKFS